LGACFLPIARWRFLISATSSVASELAKRRKKTPALVRGNGIGPTILMGMARMKISYKSNFKRNDRISLRLPVLAALLSLSISGTAQAELAKVGPISPDNHFPIYYQDAAGLRLSLCLSDNVLCLLPLGSGPVTVTDPGQPFPANYAGVAGGYPNEAFYWSATADVVTAGGGAGQLIMGVEGAFLNNSVIDGDQIVFGRIRIRIDNLIAGESYKVTTPFGIFNLVAESAGRRGINKTEDIGLVQGDFTVVLAGKVGPFLVPEGFDPANPTVFDAEGRAYIANPADLNIVTGSVIEDPHAYSTVGAVPGMSNFFRIEGPGVGNQAGLNPSPDRCLNPELGPIPSNYSDCVETNLFKLSGQVASVFGVLPQRTTYTRNSSGGGRIDVLASSVPGQQIEASILRANGKPLNVPLFEDPDGSGKYFARFSFNGIGIPLPADGSITLSNLTDLPVTTVTSPLVDTLTVTTAAFDTNGLNPGANGTLTLRVNSSDNVNPDVAVPPTLKAYNDFGDELLCSSNGNPPTAVLPDDVKVTCSVFAPGDVTIKSSAGGIAKQTVTIKGPNVSGP
jgi:hypothetical protein